VFASQDGDSHDTTSSATCPPSTEGYCLHLKKPLQVYQADICTVYALLCVIFLASIFLESPCDSPSKNVR